MKAQLWSMDLAVSAIIFIAMIGIFFFTLNNFSADASKQNELLLMQELSLEATESLIRTQGLPQDWNSGNVQVIGLAEKENVLDEGKVLEFIQYVNYEQSKTLLGIGNYDYNITIQHLNRTIMTLQGQELQMGSGCADAKDILTVERYVLLNVPAKLKFILCK